MQEGVKGKSWSESASQRIRLRASAQLQCSASERRHNAGASTKPLPRSKHSCGAGRRGHSVCAPSSVATRTKCEGDGAAMAAAGTKAGFGTQCWSASRNCVGFPLCHAKRLCKMQMERMWPACVLENCWLSLVC